ncbi:putative pentatricopeptide repeat-containing protein At1g12700, mitochondrial [Salvia miltiorrhiza]|uniref:putative pentatricopeptide repeat-containing protein At1g12700, mitochondrial n=1 Tax=Salvia miltiorrhiza TaxID=226208 RepID=UPI0025AD1A4F|nr:putative pentatricopeptide repeat-containing protein At1g12700, mitochondrial [Salvia miltiorrhiza]
MSRRAAVSAINLIHGRGFLNRWSHKSGLFLDGKEVEAVKLLEKVLDLKHCVPSNVMILHMIDGSCEAGQVIADYDWLCRLECSGWSPNIKAYNTLIDGLCKSGMVYDALKLPSKMVGKDISSSIVTYNSMIMGLCDDVKVTIVNGQFQDIFGCRYFQYVD